MRFRNSALDQASKSCTGVHSIHQVSYNCSITNAPFPQYNVQQIEKQLSLLMKFLSADRKLIRSVIDKPGKEVD